ncbi:hypothetical protein K1719_017199 [Acacia pycnantha]|nr:hypothetical protein K1719_017199 [Acacia pycnantha]
MTTTTMASFNLLPSLTHLSMLATLFVTSFSSQISIKASYMVPFECSSKINTCNALLYHINHGLDIEHIASLYSVNSSQIQPITRAANRDYLITVPCSCKIVSNLRGYFFETAYTVEQNDTYVGISEFYYSGQAWSPTDNLSIGENLTIHLPCGCTESDSQIVVTYTVQQNDTVAEIANLLSSTPTGIQNMNGILANRPSFIDVDWVLYVPRELNGIPTSKGSGKKNNHFIIIGVLVGVALLSVITILILILWRKRATETSKEDTKAVSKDQLQEHPLKDQFRIGLIFS